MQLKWCPKHIAEQIVTADRNDVAFYRSTLELLNTTWKETSMTATSKESVSDREILLVGPYGVLGTGVIDAVAANPPWRVRTAARRTAPRPIVTRHYHQQDDIVADWSSKNGTNWSVLGPHLVMGPTLNSPMNLVTSLATYAAMSRELGLPLRFPGRREGWNTLQESTDAELFGRAALWALGEEKARNEIFNVSNGDVYRWRQLWKELAAFYDLPV